MSVDTSIYFRDNQGDEGLGRRALRSGAFSIVARMANAVIQIGSVLCLARLLSPEDYGLVGMVVAVTGFAGLLVDLGSRDAIVQRPSIAPGEVSALFWLTQFVGLGCAVAVAASGPFIARFYGEPRLFLITVISSLSFVTAALMAQHYALMRRAMMFRELGVIEVTANFLSAALAIGVALAGFHYWALVLRPLVATLFVTIGVWLKVRWIPPRPTVTSSVKSMFRFGMNVTGFAMTDFVGKSGDRVAIGYRSGAVGLGYYQNALFVYDNLIDIVVGPLHGVAVASLSKLRDDHDALRRSWAKALSLLTFFSSPAFGLLSVVSQDLIVLLLSAKWKNSGLLLSVLALRGIPHTVERTCGWLHVAAGRTDRWVGWGVFLAVAQLVALFVGLPFGPFGVVVAYVLLMFLLFIPAISYSGKPLEVGSKDVIAAVWRPITGALVSTALGFALRYQLANMTMVPKIALLSLAYLGSYLLLVVGVFRLRTPIAKAYGLCADLPIVARVLAGFTKTPTARTTTARTTTAVPASSYERP